MSDESNAADQNKESNYKHDPANDMSSKRSQLREWSIVLLTAAIVTVMVWQTVLAIHRNASAEKQTGKIIAEGKRLSDAGERSAAAIEDSVAHAEETTRQTLEESRKSLNATIETARNDQRAWLGVVKPTIALPPNQKPTISVVIKNFGQSPALKVGYTLHLAWRPAGTPFTPDLSRDPKDKLSALVQPGEETTAEPTDPLPILADEQWAENVRARKTDVYISGEVHYTDIFDREHRTTFAYQLLSPSPPSKWRLLLDGNTAD